MLFIDTKLIRDTKKNKKRWRFVRFVNKIKIEKKNVSTFDEKKLNRWLLKIESFENKLSLKLKDRNLKFANVIRKTAIFLLNRCIVSRNATRFNNYSIE